MMEQKFYTLPNSLRVIEQNGCGDVCVLGFVIGTGTRDEDDSLQGIAHFTEHMLFKGTQKRSAFRILDRMGSVGGEANAYTTKEEIVLYSICLKQDYERAVELMCDMLFHSVYLQEEIENERDVVLDEINVYEDSPSDLIFDDFEKLLFAEHPFGRNILGQPDCLNRIRTADFLRFTQEQFTTDRIVFFSHSPLDFRQSDRIVSKYLQAVPDTSSRSRLSLRTVPKAVEGVKTVSERNTHQAHVLYGNAAYHLYDDRRIGLYLLNNILGGPGMNSRLNNVLREHNGLVYTVESSASNYSDTGVFSIYFGSDEKDVDRCMAIVRRELKKLRENALSTSQLHAAKKQIYGQMSISAESKESQALSMGKSMLYYNCFEGIEQTFRKIEEITAPQLLEVANEIFDEDRMSCLIYR